MTKKSSRRTSRQIHEDAAQFGDLFRLYAILLTPKQRLIFQGYLHGQSFSAIGRETGYTRQAVHEAVRGMERLLAHYEEKLGLLAAQRRRTRSSKRSVVKKLEAVIASLSNSSVADKIAPQISKLEEISQLLRETE